MEQYENVDKAEAVELLKRVVEDWGGDLGAAVDAVAAFLDGHDIEYDQHKHD